MSTLKEAEESGREYRHRNWGDGGKKVKGRRWVEYDGSLGMEAHIAVSEATSAGFEIEPEPEKPREWTLHSENETDINGEIWHVRTRTCTGFKPTVRVHDADACDLDRELLGHLKESFRALRKKLIWENGEPAWMARMFEKP